MKISIYNYHDMLQEISSNEQSNVFVRSFKSMIIEYGTGKRLRGFEIHFYRQFSHVCFPSYVTVTRINRNF